MKKLFILTGESSGDKLASKVISDLKKINQIIVAILGTKFMMWAVPDSKRFIKGIAITAVVVFLVIYFHGEYLRWAELSGNTSRCQT